jgi:hypothetical protein
MFKKIEKIKRIKPSVGFKSSKAQTVIIQFILFFLIGFGVFIGVGTLFKMHSDIFKEDAAKASLKLTGSYLTSAGISSLGCRECDIVETKLSIINSTAGYFTEVFLSSGGIKASTAPPSKQFTSSMHNLNYSLQLSGQAPSIRPINLTFNRNQNKLEVNEA